MPARHERITATLLEWYGRERRRLPWRAAPGALQDPWVVWASEVMLQQVRVATVERHFAAFLARFPDAASLAAAPVEEALRHWTGLGRYRRLHNLHAAARLVGERHGGALPRDAAALRALPGIGAYTSAAIRAMAFGEADAPMDPNLERVAARLFRVAEPLPAAKPRLAALVATLLPADRPGDLAQAMMDLGATLCLPRAPRCGDCPLRRRCAARRAGEQEVLPVLPPRPARPMRFAAAFRATRPGDGAVLLRRRPAQGLLGGTLDLPATGFGPRLPRRAAALQDAPFPAEWRRVPGLVRHALSGFEARVAVYAAEAPAGRPGGPAPTGLWLTEAEAAAEALAGLARKLLAHRPVRGQASAEPRRRIP